MSAWSSIRSTLRTVPFLREANQVARIGAEGHFTEQIAHRFPDAEIVATDLIMQAVERAAVRCREFPNLSARHHDIATDDLDGRFDLVFCMGVSSGARSRGSSSRSATASSTRSRPAVFSCSNRAAAARVREPLVDAPVP